MTAGLVEAAERFDEAVTTARRDAAVTVVEELLSAGVDPLEVMTRVIAVVQQDVGRRWQSGQWSVAQEHAATAISVAALESVARAVGTRMPDRGRVVVACAEHEWHAVPATIVASGLRAAGWDVTMLGASTPAARLSRYLQDLGPDASAVSCSVPMGLPAARAFIEASTAAGIPVLAGGAAFGPDARRAAALGATAWAPDVRSAVEVVETMPIVVRPAAPLPTELVAELGALRQNLATIVDVVAFRWQSQRESLGPPASAEEAELLRETVKHVGHAVAAALLTGDGRLLEETAFWVGALVDLAGDPASAPETELAGAMAPEIRDFPMAASLWTRHWPQGTSYG